MSNGQVLTREAPAALRVTRSGIVVISALPTTVNLNLYQGDSFALELAVYNDDDTPFNLDGVEARSQIRENPGEPIIGTFLPYLFENIVYLELTSEVSRRVPLHSVWDVDITESNGWVTTLAAGSIVMTREVTTSDDSVRLEGE